MLSSVVRLRYVVAFVSSLAAIVRLNDSCFFEPKLGAVENTIMDKLNVAYGNTKIIQKWLLLSVNDRSQNDLYSMALSWVQVDTVKMVIGEAHTNGSF